MAVRLLFHLNTQASTIPAANSFRLFWNSGIRLLSTYNINKNIKLISQEGFVDSETSKTFKNDSKPLVVLLPWLMSKERHVMKYCDMYLEHGCNIVTASISPWQFFWPVTGAQVIATQLLNYLERQNPKEQQLVIHGFSVGAYLWAEVLVRMNSDLTRYNSLIKKIKGQIWDSAVDINEASKGIPLAMFPKNALLQSAIENYVHYHLKTFHEVATKHYLKASNTFHTTPVQAPALVLISKDDPIGTFKANTAYREAWEANGMKVYWQCWENSRHVAHFMIHRDVYMQQVDHFLKDVIQKPNASTGQT